MPFKRGILGRLIVPHDTRNPFRGTQPSHSGDGRLRSAVSIRKFWYCAELVVPIHEAEWLLKNEAKILTSRKLDGLAHDFRELRTLRVGIEGG